MANLQTAEQVKAQLRAIGEYRGQLANGWQYAFSGADMADGANVRTDRPNGDWYILIDVTPISALNAEIEKLGFTRGTGAIYSLRIADPRAVQADAPQSDEPELRPGNPIDRLHSENRISGHTGWAEHRASERRWQVRYLAGGN